MVIMRRRQFLHTAAVGSSLGLAGCSGQLGSTPTATDTDTPEPTPEPVEYTNPVFEPILADPTVVRTEDGTYYAYGTEDDWHDGEGARVAPTVKSRNLVDWEYAGEAFDAKPDWKEGNVWAPEVESIDGQYVMYYAFSVWGDENPGIGVATADSPEGPFEDQGEFIRSDDIGVPNSIDPNYFVDDDGTPYLFWGSFHGIYGIELATDGLSTVGEKFQIAGDRFEAPYVYKREGSYYLMVSSGSCCDGPLTTYQVEVGRSDSLEGPYLTANGRDLMSNPGTVVVDGNNQFEGPGHHTVVHDDAGQPWMLYHAYDTEQYWIRNTPRRPLMIDPLEFEDGFPRVPGRTPNASGTGPIVETE